MKAMGEFKAMLVEYIEKQAAWREEKAREYTEDARNGLCAAALWELARYVASLPDTHEQLLRIEAEHDDAGTGVFMPGEMSASVISRFRFDTESAREAFDEFLRRLAGALAEDRRREADEE